MSFASGLDAFASGFINDHEPSDAVGVFTRYEVGKDWWVSETWSVGVAFTYGNLFVISDSYYEEKGNRQSLFPLRRFALPPDPKAADAQIRGDAAEGDCKINHDFTCLILSRYLRRSFRISFSSRRSSR